MVMAKRKICKKRKEKPQRVEYHMQRDGVTQSMLQNYFACRQRAKFSLDGWRRVGGSKRAIEFGNLFHFLLEKWYSAKPSASASASASASTSFFETCADQWLVRAAKIGDDLQAVEEDLARAAPVFRGYIDYWSKADRQKTWVELEETFDVIYQMFPGWTGKYRLRGRCDGIFYSKKQRSREYWLFETKTKGVISEDTISAALAFDFQNQFYITAKELETRKKITGVVYNVIRRPGAKLNAAGDIQELGGRIKADVEKQPDHYFKRFEVPYPREILKKFKEKELPNKLLEFNAWWNGFLYCTFKNQSACVSRWNCEYLDACADCNGKMVGYVQDGRLFPELED